MNKNIVSEYTIRRLPLYLNLLHSFKSSGKVYTSAAEISRMLGIYPTQVRKDLAFTGLEGKPRVGHKIENAISVINTYLGWNETLNAIMIGAGNVGSALIGYQEMVKTGINILAMFDIDETKIGCKKRGIDVYSIDNLEEFCKEMNVEMAIIATPPNVAQGIGNKLVSIGITTLWNLTSEHIEIPENVIYEHTCFSSSLAVLTERHKNKDLK